MRLKQLRERIGCRLLVLSHVSKCRYLVRGSMSITTYHRPVSASLRDCRASPWHHPPPAPPPAATSPPAPAPSSTEHRHGANIAHIYSNTPWRHMLCILILQKCCTSEMKRPFEKNNIYRETFDALALCISKSVKAVM